MHYYGTRLSENISRREPEGYLLCLNVPVARTGSQDYLPEELGLPPRAASGGNSVGGNLTRNKRSPRGGAAPIEGAEVPPGSSFISVYRPEEEVFSPETIASFEGMPVTNDHPPEGVDTSNIRALQKGHAHNVRRGTGDESDLLLADLIITDPGLISLILEEGKREISCGYTYELCEENGQYIQRKIRGNHVAVVDAGRAGHRVSIKDHKTTISERSIPKMKKSIVKKLVRMAKDGDPDAIEAVAELLEEVAEGESLEIETDPVAAPEPEEVAEAVGEPEVVVETPSGSVVAVDEESIAGILERLDRIIELLAPAARDEDPVEEIAEAVEEAIEAAAAAEAAEELPVTVQEVSEIVEEILDPAAEESLPELLTAEGDECGDPEAEVISTGDVLRAALRPMKPMLAKMPKRQKDRICADIAVRLNGKTRRVGVYGAMNDSARKQAAADPADLGKKIMAKRNPNYKQ